MRKNDVQNKGVKATNESDQWNKAGWGRMTVVSLRGIRIQKENVM